MENYNYSKLLGEMRAKGITQEGIAKALNRNVATINLKLNNRGYFTQSEIDAICDILDILPEQVGEYFFAH